MPENITELTDEQLGNLQSLYSHWREYTEDLHTRALWNKVEARTQYDRLYSRTFLVTDGKTVKEREFTVMNNSRVQALDDICLQADGYQQLLSDMLDSFSNALATISREITRRDKRY